MFRAWSTARDIWSTLMQNWTVKTDLRLRTSGRGVTLLGVGHPRREEEEVFFHQVPSVVS